MLSEENTASAVGLPRRSCSSLAVAMGRPSRSRFHRYPALSSGRGGWGWTDGRDGTDGRPWGGAFTPVLMVPRLGANEHRPAGPHSARMVWPPGPPEERRWHRPAAPPTGP